MPSQYHASRSGMCAAALTPSFLRFGMFIINDITYLLDEGTFLIATR